MLGRVMSCAALVAACSANEPSDQQANFDLMRYEFAPRRLPYATHPLSCGPHCHDVIPPSTLMGAVAREEHDFAWQGALRVLSERDPTPGTQQFLFASRQSVREPPNLGDVVRVVR